MSSPERMEMLKRIEENRVRIRELLDLVTEIQADIARLDAAS